MGDSADVCKCGREVRDDGRRHDGSAPCLVHVDTGLHACDPDSDQLATLRAFSDELRREA
jgi:hypothetical protein